MTTIIIFGAGGQFGRIATGEALRRGHRVSAVVRDPEAHADLATDGVRLVAGDAADPASVAALATGHDVAIASLYQTALPHDVFYAATTAALLDGLPRAGVGRLLVVGMAGNLEAEPGVRMMDDPSLPTEHQTFMLGHTVGLHLLRATSAPIDWLMLTPPEAFAVDGPRTGRYRLGGDALLRQGDAPSRGSYADLAVAMLDEIERPAHHRTRIAVAD